MAGKPSHVATYHLGESRSMGRERWGRACEGFHQLNQFLDGEWLPDERNPCQSNVGRFEFVRLSRRHEADRDVRPVPPDLDCKVEPVHLRHAHVADDDAHRRRVGLQER